MFSFNSVFFSGLLKNSVKNTLEVRRIIITATIAKMIFLLVMIRKKGIIK